MITYFPNFLCVGAQKTATSSFSEMIKMHPDVFAPDSKEINYFNREFYKNNGLLEYGALFSDAGGYKIRTECSPNYLYVEDVPNRILELLGADTKILIFLRHPIDRSFSHYMMMRNKGYENSSFEESFYKEPERLKFNDKSKSLFSYFDRSLYSAQVKRYLDLFPNVKIVFFEDFIKNNALVMNEIYDFLDIEKISIPLAESNIGTNAKLQWLEIFLAQLTLMIQKNSYLRNNQTLKLLKRKVRTLNEKPKEMVLSAEFKKTLQAYFYEDICKLELLIGQDLNRWKVKYAADSAIFSNDFNVEHHSYSLH